MTREADIQAAIRLAVGRLPNVRLFRNNRGQAWMGEVVSRRNGIVTLAGAHPVVFGLTDGASDLIGLTQVVVTPAHVGQKLAVFTAAEVKQPGKTVPDHQRNFVVFVRDFGGIAGVVRSPEDALRLIGGETLL